jgi:hypothetical protein
MKFIKRVCDSLCASDVRICGYGCDELAENRRTNCVFSVKLSLKLEVIIWKD